MADALTLAVSARRPCEQMMARNDVSGPSGAAFPMTVPSLPIAIVGAGSARDPCGAPPARASTGPAPCCCANALPRSGAGRLTPATIVHLLNVRAADVSAYPDRPMHFVDWLQRTSGQLPDTDRERQIHDTPSGTFVSRDLYGRYLTSLLRDTLGENRGALRLRIIPDEVVDLEPAGPGYRLALAGGPQHAVAGAVLAAGHLLQAESGRGAYIANPWSAAVTHDLDPNRPVVILGTGLSERSSSRHTARPFTGGSSCRPPANRPGPSARTALHNSTARKRFVYRASGHSTLNNAGAISTQTCDGRRASDAFGARARWTPRSSGVSAPLALPQDSLRISSRVQMP